MPSSVEDVAVAVDVVVDVVEVVVVAVAKSGFEKLVPYFLCIFANEAIWKQEHPIRTQAHVLTQFYNSSSPLL